MRTPDKQSGLVQGTLDMLILNTLALEPLHGYGIGVRLEQISKGAFRINAGSLFPAFRRLERDGLISGEWRLTENGRRAKYYTLTAPGRAALKRETWNESCLAPRRAAGPRRPGTRRRDDGRSETPPTARYPWAGVPAKYPPLKRSLDRATKADRPEVASASD